MYKNIENVMADANSRKWLLTILILAVIVRVLVVFLFFRDYQPTDDAWEWTQAAQNLLNGHGLIVNEDLKAYRTPIPGLYIAAIYAICGISPRAVEIVNIVLGVFTVWLVYDLVRRTFGIMAARWSALCTSCYPLFLLYTGHLLSETLILMLLALALWLVWLLRACTAIWFAPVGIVLGLAVLTRETALPIAVLIALWTLIGRDIKKWQHWASPALVILVFLALTLIPWTVRNYIIMGQFIPLTSQSGTSLWIANNPLADGTGEKKFLPIPQVEALPEFERGVAYRALAIEFISEAPARFAQLALRRLQYFWHLGYHGEGLAEIAFLAVYLPLLGLATIGAWIGWWLNRNAVLLLLIVPLSLTAVHMVFLPVGRYRLPAELVMCMLAGVGAAWGFSKMTGRLRTSA